LVSAKIKIGGKSKMSKKFLGILFASALALMLIATPAFASGTVSVTVTANNFGDEEYDWTGMTKTSIRPIIL
jgi:hypothetical protein